MVTDSAGNVLERLSYDPWGDRRASNGAGDPTNAIIPSTTDRGFTGHEHLDLGGMGLVHMNGRIYDPTLGRFLSPDPYIQSPYHSQSYNRYSYVWNNPLTMTDPTGYVVNTTPVWNFFSNGECWGAGCSGGVSWPGGGGGGSGAASSSKDNNPRLNGKTGGSTANESKPSVNFADSYNPVLVSNQAGNNIVYLSAGDIWRSIAAGAGNFAATTLVGLANVLVVLGDPNGNAQLFDKVKPFDAKSNYFARQGEATADGLSLLFGVRSFGKMESGMGATAKAAEETSKVGRWMSETEFNVMNYTGRVVEGAGGRTYVVNPANPGAYTSAGSGSPIYAEFNVPTSVLKPGSKPEWSVIPGPNVTTRLYGPPPANLAPATCIVCVIRKP